ncbi:hypothetical protein [Stygiolobus caldivivus]|uniref:DUF5615 domain-containing protein n=1 Tax=Stygiolobus caldivivus TaxID=2824673 RepID=A0A8D5ZHJ7_9CREN|nr:hypothetical protein [Stygiolobus caldivivus]BCU69764.1 hypothetical protein KN1_10610 [Stygiolobus caldivivus]
MGDGAYLIFDLPLRGFYNWSRKRLEYLGFRPVMAPYRYDHHIMAYALMVNGVVITTDKDFLKFSRAVVLKVDKYEKMYVRMLKGVRQVLDNG